jgi:uncharacterized protein YgbK (DUF1537 family)
MIAVLADDLSGAAELAGAALRHGLRAEVQTVFDPASDADVVCVDLGTRSGTAPAATAAAAEAARLLAAARPAWIYKKCDSVLRGHVLVELRAIMEAADRPRAILIPANPSRQRVIRGGHLFVEDRPLHATAFARDPEHPRTTSNVAELLGGDLRGVSAPDVDCAADLARQAQLVDAGTLAGGGVEFFAALLARSGFPPSGSLKTPAREATAGAGPLGSEAGPATLLVCGSAASWNERRRRADQDRIPTFSLPAEVAAVAGAIRTLRRALLGIGDGAATRGVAPAILVGQLAALAAAVLQEVPVERLMLEGGATAAAVVRALGWTRLQACEAAAPGIGTLRPAGKEGPILSIKPGSYPWPPELWP